MKVLNIMTSSLTYNGISMSIMNYFRNIDNSKVQMDFVVPNIVDKEIKEEIESKECKIYELVYHNGKMRQKRPIKYCRKLYKILKDEEYDAVHVHGSSAMMFMELWVAKKAKCKIRIAHSRNTKSDNEKLHNFCKPFFKHSYTDAFACGKEAGEWLFGKNSDFIIIPNGKDSNMFKYNDKIRKEYRNKYGIKDKIVIGHVGNFFYQKNHDFLIDVFHELTLLNEKYYLVMIGYGDLEEKIRKKVEQLEIQDRVLFLGKISSDDVAKWLQAMDIMVFPSRFEGFPNVLVEWQMAGLPCLISDKITDKVKLTDLVQFASIEEKPKKWAERIKDIKLEDREKRNDMLLDEIKEKGFDIKENAKKLEKIYIQLYNRENRSEKD